MSLIRKHGAVLQAWACLALVVKEKGKHWKMRTKRWNLWTNLLKLTFIRCANEIQWQ